MKIKYIHLRYNDPRYQDKVYNMGGCTIAYEISDPPTPDGDVELRLSLSVCSDHDNFCRKEGRAKAKYRLLGESKRWSHSELLPASIVKDLNQADLILTAAQIWPNYLRPWELECQQILGVDKWLNNNKEHLQQNKPQEEVCQDSVPAL